MLSQYPLLGPPRNSRKLLFFSFVFTESYTEIFRGCTGLLNGLSTDPEK